MAKFGAGRKEARKEGREEGRGRGKKYWNQVSSPDVPDPRTQATNH